MVYGVSLHGVITLNLICKHLGLAQYYLQKVRWWEREMLGGRCWEGDVETVRSRWWESRMER